MSEATERRGAHSADYVARLATRSPTGHEGSITSGPRGRWGRLVRVFSLAGLALVILASLMSTERAAAQRSGDALIGSTAVGSSATAALGLRTCIDRWNQGNMLGWGPTLVSVAIRRLDARERADLGFRSPGRPRCTASLAVHSPRGATAGCSGEAVMPGQPKFCVNKRSTWVCVINAFGAYQCPTHADDASPLRDKNATTDKRGVLMLDVPLKNTRPTPPLGWQRLYPHTDGFIEPWTPAGRLRQGLRLTLFGKSFHGRCDQGSQQTVAKSALRCWSDATSDLFDPCFPPTSLWNRRGIVIACASPGDTNFARFVITKRS
jgi:hypothetical protein